MHRLVACAFIPKVNNCSDVNHIDGDKTNNNVNNLEWTNDSLNAKHAYYSGLMSGNKTKLKVSEVLEIYELLEYSNLTATQIAKKYNVKPSTIYNINIGKTWKHLFELWNST